MFSVSFTHIPLLKELKRILESLGSYKHLAPTGPNCSPLTRIIKAQAPEGRRPSAYQAAQPRLKLWRSTLRLD